MNTETNNASFGPGEADPMRGPTGRTELLPCPFCGAPGFLVGGVTAYEVKCTNTDCTARGREHPNRGEAITAWNRRAPSVPAAPPTALREAMQALKGARAEISYFRRHAPDALPAGHELLPDKIVAIDAALVKLRETLKGTQ